MLILSRKECERLLDLDALVDAIAAAMVDLSSGRASVPDRIAASVEEHSGLLAAMPAYLPCAKILACKLVTVYPHNDRGPHPTHQALIMVFDPSNGSPIALMDGEHITAARTAAGSALATKLLARKDARTLAILGTGVQAWSHVRAIPRVARIESIRVAGHTPGKAAQFAKAAAEELGIPARAAETWADAQNGADIVCAATHPHDPVLRLEWLSPGAHVNSIGFSPFGQEVDAHMVSTARVFVEKRETATAPSPTGSVELHSALMDGKLSLDVLTEIGEVVSGQKPGRQSEDEMTLYRSVGVAVQDAAAAALVLSAAASQGLGTELAH